MTEVDIAISKLSKKGNGVGIYTRQDQTNWPVEVPFTMPGDQVQVLLGKKRGGSYESRLKVVVVPSPQRVEARCIHFGSCGGCRWQHMPYALQLEIKEQFIRNCFASLLDAGVDFRPILGCDPPWAYRNKMEFSFSSDKSRNKYLGLVMYASKGRVFHLTECHLVNPWFAKGVKAVREWWEESDLDAYHPHHNTGSLRTLILREGQRTGDRMAMLTVSGNPDYALKRNHLKGFVSKLKSTVAPENPDSRFSLILRIQQLVKGQETNFYEMILEGPDTIREVLEIKTKPEETAHRLTFDISPSAFFQPNTRQAERLFSAALQMLEIPPHAVVYDLYCGTGTLGICAGNYAQQVIGIELSPEAVLDAKANAKQNNMDNVTILSGAVHRVLEQHEKEDPLPKPDVVMVDPPRAGLDPHVIRQLLALSPQKILYISCNPVTQASNCAELVKGGYYQLIALQPVDQFPQTPHVENIAILQKI